MGKNERVDQRMRTRIVDATERLCESTPFEKILVSDICNEADISRPTFYRHFKDKDEVVQWLLANETFVPVFQIGRTCTWFEGFEAAAEKVQERGTLIFSAYQDNRGYQSMVAFARRELVDAFRETVTEFKGAELTESLDFKIRFFCSGGILIGYNYSKKGGMPSPQVYAQLICESVPPELFNFLNEPTQPSVDLG